MPITSFYNAIGTHMELPTSSKYMTLSLHEFHTFPRRANLGDASHGGLDGLVSPDWCSAFNLNKHCRQAITEQSRRAERREPRSLSLQSTRNKFRRLSIPSAEKRRGYSQAGRSFYGESQYNLCCGLWRLARKLVLEARSRGPSICRTQRIHTYPYLPGRGGDSHGQPTISLQNLP